MSDIKDWSPQAAGNNAVAPNGFPEQMPAGDLNNSARELQAAVRRDWELTHGVATSTGSGGAYVLSYAVSPLSYFTGMAICFRANHANTGAATLNVNTLGAKAILTNSGGALEAGDILANGFYFVVYDGVAFRMINTGARYARYA